MYSVQSVDVFHTVVPYLDTRNSTVVDASSTTDLMRLVLLSQSLWLIATHAYY